MNKHYTNYLNKKYYPLYSRGEGMSHFWFECGDGWFNLINQLSAYLCADWLYAQDEYDRIKNRLGQPLCANINHIVTADDIEAARVEMVESLAEVPHVRQVKEKFGSLRFYATGVSEEHNGAIDLAERMSNVTCEVCGAPGRVKSYHGWMSCRCKAHTEV